MLGMRTSKGHKDTMTANRQNSNLCWHFYSKKVVNLYSLKGTTWFNAIFLFLSFFIFGREWKFCNSRLSNVWLNYLSVVFALLPAKYWVISIHRRWNCSWKRFCSTESKWMDGPLTTAEAVTKMTSNCSIEIHNAEQSHCGNFEKLL